MKAIFTLLIIILAGVIVSAQTPQVDDKINTIEMGIVLVGSFSYSDSKKTTSISTETSVARLYRYKNARVNKELAFITIKNYSKLE